MRVFRVFLESGENLQIKATTATPETSASLSALVFRDDKERVVGVAFAAHTLGWGDYTPEPLP